MISHRIKLISTVLIITLLMSICFPLSTGAKTNDDERKSSAEAVTDDVSYENYPFSNTDPFIKVTDENGVHFYGAIGDLRVTEREKKADNSRREKFSPQVIGSSLDEAKDLPKSVDLSESKYFPKIGDQGGLGSCGVWSAAYYQFSYELNRLMDREATPQNCASTKFVFNNINNGTNEGTTPEQNYAFLRNYGAVSIAQIPYDENFTDWNAYDGVWREAMKWRLKDYHSVDDVGTEEKAITSADDPDLYEIKKLLSEGEVLTYSTYIYSWEMKNLKKHPDAPENDKFENEYVATRLTGSSGAHRMTLVGYNDNIWTDINDNNIIDSGEMGAFKIANSWSDGYANKGFSWVAYDAMNEISSVEGMDKTRRPSILTAFYHINVRPVEDKAIYLEFTLNTLDRRQTGLEVFAEKDGTVFSHKFLWAVPYRGAENNFSYNGTKEASDGIFTMNLDLVVPDITPETFGDYKFSVVFTDYEKDSVSTTLKEIKLINEYRDETYTTSYSLPVTLDGDSCELELKDCENTNKTVYYIGFESPTIHYKDGDSQWQSAQMSENIERLGSNRKYTIENTTGDVLLYFTDENGNIDDNEGKYYVATDRLSFYRTKNVKEPVSISHFGFANGEVDLVKRMTFDLVGKGGYEPYNYQYIIENLDTGEIKSYDYDYPYDKSHAFYDAGNFRITGYIKDQAGDEAFCSFDVEARDRDFIFSSFEVTSPDEVLFVGNPLVLTGKSEFESVMSYGPFHSEYEFIIKDSEGQVVHQIVKRNDYRHLSDKRSTTTLTWTPPKAGTFTATISSTDGNKQYAEKAVTFTVLDKLYGDADSDGVIKIKDATLVQKFAAALVGSESLNLETADCSSNDEVNVIDATLIQKYLAEFENTGLTGSAVVYIPPVEPTIPTEPETEPETEPTAPTDPPKNNKVTFTNSFRWSGPIYCYYWSDSNPFMINWPGISMDYLMENSYGEYVYTLSLPEDIDYVIFTNGTSQTTDIPYPGGEIRYYPIAETDNKGHNKVNTW